jgi:hypothetical protein
MWQIVDLSTVCNVLLFDNQTIRFNLSAWIGGWDFNDDNARVSLTFTNQANAILGNTTTLGPILAANRSNITSLLFRKAIGLVPSGARSFQVQAIITRASGVSNDGAIDNIAIVLY